MVPLLRQNYDALLLANHGAVTLGADVMNAHFKMETVEFVRPHRPRCTSTGAHQHPRTTTRCRPWATATGPGTNRGEKVRADS